MSILQSLAVVNGRGTQAPEEYAFEAYWVDVCQRGMAPDGDRLRGLLVAYDKQRAELAELRHRMDGLEK